MSVNFRLRQFLDTEGLKITVAADRSGIPYRSMQNYLSGEREPGVDALTAMNTRLGISIDWLLTGEGRMYRTGNDFVAENSRESAVLALLRQLPDDDQQEIQLAVQNKKWMRDIEHRLEAVTTALAGLHTA